MTIIIIIKVCLDGEENAASSGSEVDDVIIKRGGKICISIAFLQSVDSVAHILKSGRR